MKKTATATMQRSMYELFGVGNGGIEVVKAEPIKAPAPVNTQPSKAASTEKPVPVPPPAPAASFLAAGTVLEGTLRAKGDVEIAGELKGSVTTDGAVRLRSNIESSITAKSVEVLHCVLTGDISAAETVTLSEGSRVLGGVTAKTLLCAGEVTGDLQVTDSVRLESKSRINGNITTASLSVEEGAVINGNVRIGKATDK